MTDADELPRNGSTDDPPDPGTVELLERTFAVRAADAPRAVGLAGHARAARRRKLVRRGTGTAVLAAAAVGVAIAVPYALTGSKAPTLTTFSGGPPAVETTPDGYRWESTRGVEFLVPAAWRYGISGEVPCPSDDAAPVGGEVGLSRAYSTLMGCASALPKAQWPPHVWIDFPPAKPQKIDYGGGLVDEGREVAGVIVSVLSDDAAVRSQVLDSLQPVGAYDVYGCAPSDPIATEPAERPVDTGGLPSPDAVTGVALCRYQLPSSLDSTSADVPLEASAPLDADQGAELVAAIEAAPIGVGPEDDPANCLDPLGDDAIVMRVFTTDGVTEAYLRYSGCTGHGVDDGTAQRMLTTEIFATIWPAELMRPSDWQMALAPVFDPLIGPAPDTPTAPAG